MTQLWQPGGSVPDGVPAEAPIGGHPGPQRAGPRPEISNLAAFGLVAEVADNLATARWGAAGFRCDADLLRRAEIVVALGEIIARPDGGQMDTTVDPRHPLALLCTLIRASDRVIDLRLDLTIGGPAGQAA